jgi:ketosteroid isomerase-like protein
MLPKHHAEIGGAMTQANVEMVRDVYDAFARGDVDAVFAAMTPDIEWDKSPGMPYGGVYHGRDAIVANVFGPILADVEGFTASPDEILALDDVRVIARGRHRRITCRARRRICAYRRVARSARPCRR